MRVLVVSGLLMVVISLILGVQGQDRPKRKVVSIMDAPFLMERRGERTGNDRYEGFIPDLLREIGDITREEYEIYLSPDKKYGSQNKDGSWDGMVGEVMKGAADIAAASLTVTFVRSKVIDFTKPIMTTGLQILYKKPERTTANLNMFSPFSAEVWICIIGIYVVSGVGLYLINRCVPNASKTDDEEEEQEERSELGKVADSFWLLIRVFALQGFRDRNIGWSARILLGTWLMFSMMTVLLFGAALVSWFPALVAGIRPPVPFKDADSLLDSGIKFGCLNGGSTKNFFKVSTVSTYEKMSFRMETDRSYAGTVNEGIQRVRQGNFAFLGESQMLEYAANRQPCDLVVVGEQMTSNAYALATAKNSRIKEKLDQAIIQLRETGALQKLYNKWWHDVSRCPKQDADADSKEGASENPDKVLLKNYLSAGPVLIFAVGLMVAVVAAGVEVIWNKRGLSETIQQKPKPSKSEPSTSPKADVV